jgi:4-amino-4-deoxy-L-arabinose transferase-like glycosyltransferase
LLTTYLLGRELLGEHAALIAAGLLALNGFMLAFSRIVQYQSIVVWMSALALLCVWEWRKNGHTLWPVLAGVFIGVGLLAHYDTILVTPALIYLTISPLKSRHSKPTSLMSQLGPLLAAACLLLVIVGLFYIPYLFSPQLADTKSHVSGRIGSDLLKNLLGHFLHYNVFYNSFYYLFVTGLLALGFLASTLPYAPVVKRIPAGRYWVPALAVSLILGLMFRPEALQFSPGLDLAALPFALLLLGAFVSSALNPGQRAVVAWLAIPFLGYNFAVADPKTHIYTIVPAWALLAGLAAARVWQSRISKPKSLLLAAGVLLLTVLFSGYLYIAYLRRDVEYVPDWPAGRLALFWAPVPYNDIPPGDFFGFVHRTGWKAAGGLYALGKLNGSY